MLSKGNYSSILPSPANSGLLVFVHFSEVYLCQFQSAVDKAMESWWLASGLSHLISTNE